MKIAIFLCLAFIAPILFTILGYDRGWNEGNSRGIDLYTEALQELSNKQAESHEYGFKEGICFIAKAIHEKKKCNAEFTGSGYILTLK